jgi:hypothetical protein
VSACRPCHLLRHPSRRARARTGASSVPVSTTAAAVGRAGASAWGLVSAGHVSVVVLGERETTRRCWNGPQPQLSCEPCGLRALCSVQQAQPEPGRPAELRTGQLQRGLIRWAGQRNCPVLRICLFRAQSVHCLGCWDCLLRHNALLFGSRAPRRGLGPGMKRTAEFQPRLPRSTAQNIVLISRLDNFILY